MKSFFQRLQESRSGTRKPKNDLNSTYHQIWLPTASKPNDDRTRHRTNQDSLDATLSGDRPGEKRSSSRAPRAPEPNYESHAAPSSYNYATYPSNGKGSHTATHTQGARVADAMPPPRFYPEPQHPDDASSQRPPRPVFPPALEVRKPPSQQAPAEDHRKRPDGRPGNSNRAGEREPREVERNANTARYETKDTERLPQEADHPRHRANGRRDDADARNRYRQDRPDREPRDRETRDRETRDRETRDRETRDREKRHREREREKEKEREKEREREREREQSLETYHQEKRRDKERVHEREKERRHRENGREKERERDRDRHTERGVDRKQDREITREQRREQRRADGQHREREEEVHDRKGKTRRKDEEQSNLTRRQERDTKGLGLRTEDPGTSGVPQVYRGQQEEEIQKVFSRPHQERDSNMEENIDQRRQKNVAPRPERSTDVRKDRHNYLDRRYEPERAAWGSAAISQPYARHRHPSANDETTSDSSPRRRLPTLSKHKQNLTDVEAANPTLTNTWTRRDYVPSPPSDPALVRLRQATFASSSGENQAKGVNINPSPLSLEHHDRDLTLTSTEQLSRQGPSGITLGEIDDSTRKDHPTVQSGGNANFLSSLDTNNGPTLKANVGQPKHEGPSKGLSSRWPFYKGKTSSQKPSAHLIETITSVDRVDAQKKHPDTTIPTRKTKYSSASQQAALREARNPPPEKNMWIPGATETHLQKSQDIPSVVVPSSQLGLSGHPTIAHPESHLQTQVPSLQSLVQATPLNETPTLPSLNTENPGYGPYYKTGMPLMTTIHPSGQPLAASSSSHQQTTQVLSPYMNRPLDAPIIDSASRKRTESAASKHRAPGQDAYHVRGTSKVPQPVVLLDAQPPVSSHPAGSARIFPPAETSAPETARRRSSELVDTRSHTAGHTRNEPYPYITSKAISTPLAGYSVLKEASLQEQPAPPAISFPQTQTYSGLGSSKLGVAQGILLPSSTTHIVSEEKLPSRTQASDKTTRPTNVPTDIISDPKAFPSHVPLDHTRSHMEPGYTESVSPQQGHAASDPSNAVLAYPNGLAVPSTQLGIVEHASTRGRHMQSQHRIQGAVPDNAFQSEAYPLRTHYTQDSSATFVGEARAASFPLQSSSIVTANHLPRQAIGTENIAQVPPSHTTNHTTRPHEQPPTVFGVTDSRSRPPSIYQTSLQQKMSETIAGTGHDERTSSYQRILQDVNPPSMKKMSSRSSFIPATSNLLQAHTPSHQIVDYVNAGSSVEDTINGRAQPNTVDLTIASHDVKLRDDGKPAAVPNFSGMSHGSDSRQRAAGIGEVSSFFGSVNTLVTHGPQDSGPSSIPPGADAEEALRHISTTHFVCHMNYVVE
ncbi:hypothetical protein C0991_004237 [Blastosporella zonata]|nr:hypothetical protein C0991_004237 [Blastosporella zonata]